jgi:hypothetical protein
MGEKYRIGVIVRNYFAFPLKDSLFINNTHPYLGNNSKLYMCLEYAEWYYFTAPKSIFLKEPVKVHFRCKTYH